MPRFETVALALTVAVAAVTTWRNLLDMRPFEIVALVMTVVIMGAVILRDLLATRRTYSSRPTSE